MKVETLPIGKLREDPNNARKHPKRNIEAIKASLKRFGQQKPIVIAKDGVVVAGNGTLAAARELGWAEIRAIQTGLPKREALAFAIADNRTSELALWNDEELAKALAEVSLGEDGLAEATGFTLSEIDRMCGKLANGGGLQEDEVPEPPKNPVTKPGDLWILGEQRILCGDSTKDEDVARIMRNDSFQMVFTDPPYGVAYQDPTKMSAGYASHRRKDGKVVTNDSIGPEATRALVRDSLKILDAHWNKGGSFYVCAPAGDMELHFRLAIRDAGLELHQQIVWAKDVFAFGRSDYQWRHETILYGWKGGAAHFFSGGRKQDTVWEIPRPRKSEEHPTMKPVALVAKAIENSSRRGEIVWDSFSGSGTTLVAAEQLGRRCFAMEISPAFVDVAVERWQNLTGKKAKLKKK